MPDVEITARRVSANGVEFGVLEAGSGPLVLCLHGFPDTAHTWRHLLPELAAAGFHAVAPHLRGYAPSSAPADGSYQLGALVADANALHGVLGGDDQAVVIGHDWGAGTAYAAAAFAPTLWRKLVILAVGPPAVTMPYMGSYDQLKRSWYMSVCASPYGDALLAADDFAFVERLWRDWSPGYDASADLAEVRKTFSVPGSLAAALAYYRAALNPSDDLPRYAGEQTAGIQLAPQPTLYLHGAEDGCIGSDVAAAATQYLAAPGSRVQVIADAGHFLQVEQPEIVNRLIVEHLAARP
jgi:pimeloyl-ACP methyl ester carboxylesterase